MLLRGLQYMRLTKTGVARYHTPGIHALPSHILVGIACRKGVVLRTTAEGQEVFAIVQDAHAIAMHPHSTAYATVARSKATAWANGAK